RRAQAARRAPRGAADDAPRTARPRRDLPAGRLSGSHEEEPPMTAPSPFRKELEAAVNARHSRLNPFTEKWVKGELSRAQLGAWAAQHYQYVSQFPRWCATVYGECPDPDARDFLLENIIEADEVHGERGYAIVERHATTPEKKAEAIEAVRQATLMRWQYMTGLHRAFILKEEP